MWLEGSCSSLSKDKQMYIYIYIWICIYTYMYGPGTIPGKSYDSGVGGGIILGVDPEVPCGKLT